MTLNVILFIQFVRIQQGRIQDFKLGGGGGGGALKKIAPSGGRCNFLGGISCEKSRFYANKSYFFQLRREARNFWGISCEKSRFYAKKSYFFTILGGCAPPPPPPLPPCTVHAKLCRFPPLTNAAIVIKCFIIKLFVQNLTLFHNLNYVWLHQVFFSSCLVIQFGGAYGLFYNFSFYRKYN